jgi:hypothetical protein
MIRTLSPLCPGCHAAHHPESAGGLGPSDDGLIGVRLAKLLDREGQLGNLDESLGVALRLFRISRLRGLMSSARGLCIALTALVAACQQSPPPESGDDLTQDPTQDPMPTWLTSDGWGELRIGMSRQEVVATLGEDANPTAVGGPDPEQCDQFRPERAPDGMLVMIEDGRLTRISVSAGAGVETKGGIAVGDSASAIRSQFASNVVSTPHKYWPAPAEYLTVWAIGPPGPDPKGVVYEVDEEGRVVHIHAGGSSIQYVEGCL